MRWADYDVQALDANVPGIGHVLHIKVQKVSRRGGISWDTLQQIKNEIAGDEAVAIEIYPPESQVVDELNMRHLWVMPPDMPLPTLRR